MMFKVVLIIKSEVRMVREKPVGWKKKQPLSYTNPFIQSVSARFVASLAHWAQPFLGLGEKNCFFHFKNCSLTPRKYENAHKSS